MRGGDGAVGVTMREVYLCFRLREEELKLLLFFIFFIDYTKGLWNTQRRIFFI